MGYGAIISGLVSAGIDIYNQASQQSPQARAGQYGNQIKVLSDALLGPYANNPNYWNIDVPGMANQSIQFGLQNAPAINTQNMQQLQSMLGQALPGYQGMVNKATANTRALLGGKIPTDVQQQIQRSDAFATMQSGAFAGGASTGALTARDLGLTSLNLQQTGFNQAQGLISTARNYLMPQPVNPMSLLPLSDLISGTEWSKSQTYNATANFYNARANALAAQYGSQVQQGVSSNLGAGIGSLLGALTGTNPAQSGGGSSSNSMGGLLGMLFGSGNNMIPSGMSSGGGDTVGGFTGGTSDFSSLFGNAMGV